MGRDRSVDIATRYGLGGLWIEPEEARDFLIPAVRSRGPAILIHWVSGLFPGVKGKAAGGWR